MNQTAARLDAFTDAAFAFAVSLMVVGAGGGTLDYAALQTVLRSIPSFAIGFAIIAMFWFAHVRWRTYRGEGDWRSTLLTIVLIFTVLVYIHPLRAMASSFASFLSGQRDAFGGHLAEMFAVYGFGFAIMAGLTAALYHDAQRNPALSAETRHNVRGESWIWMILLATGLVSTAMTFIRPLANYAPFAYATLPLSNMLFDRLWKWRTP